MPENLEHRPDAEEMPMRPTIEMRSDRKAVLILCRFRHVIDCVPLAEWPGSIREAECSNTMQCPVCLLNAYKEPARTRGRA